MALDLEIIRSDPRRKTNGYDELLSKTPYSKAVFLDGCRKGERGITIYPIPIEGYQFKEAEECLRQEADRIKGVEESLRQELPSLIDNTKTYVPRIRSIEDALRKKRKKTGERIHVVYNPLEFLNDEEVIQLATHLDSLDLDNNLVFRECDVRNRWEDEGVYFMPLKEKREKRSKEASENLATTAGILTWIGVTGAISFGAFFNPNPEESRSLLAAAIIGGIASGGLGGLGVYNFLKKINFGANGELDLKYYARDPFSNLANKMEERTWFMRDLV